MQITNTEIKSQLRIDFPIIFREALLALKIEKEIEKLNEEAKDFDSLSPDEFKERYSEWNMNEIKELRRCYYENKVEIKSEI